MVLTALQKLAAEHPQLSPLSLACCSKVTDKRVAMLAAGYPHLSLLDLAGCSNVKDEGMWKLAAGHPQMSTLTLSCCSNSHSSAALCVTTPCRSLRRSGGRGMHVVHRFRPWSCSTKTSYVSVWMSSADVLYPEAYTWNVEAVSNELLAVLSIPSGNPDSAAREPPKSGRTSPIALSNSALNVLSLPSFARADTNRM